MAGAPLATLAIWAAQHLILVATIGTTIGHRVFGLRVVREDGVRTVGFVKAAIRTLMIALVIPAVVWDDEGRGLHDRAAGTRLSSLEDCSLMRLTVCAVLFDMDGTLVDSTAMVETDLDGVCGGQRRRRRRCHRLRSRKAQPRHDRALRRG